MLENSIIKKEELVRNELTNETPEEAVLSSFDKEGGRSLDESANTVVFINLRNDGSAIFKPKNGEKEALRAEVKEGTYYKRERAAYLLDKFLGFNLVPPTVIRDIDDEIGSLQQFIPDAKAGMELSVEELEDPNLEAELLRLWIFDFIIHNSDRHRWNFLVKDSKVHAIDNGLSFGNDPLKTIYEVSDKAVPQDIVDGITRFLTQDGIKNLCEDLMGELISKTEVDYCMKRIKTIYDLINKYGRIPTKVRKELQLVF